jgi:integrase
MAKVVKRRWTAPDGSMKEAWRVDYRDAAGVRRAKQFTKKAEAEAHRRKVERELDDGTHMADTASITVANAVDRWIAAGRLRDWRTSTERQAQQHGEHINRRLGEFKLSKLTHHDIEAFAICLVNDMSRPLAKKVLTSLKAVLRKSRRGHLVDGVSIKSNGSRKLEVGRDIPTREEVQLIIEHSRGKWRAMNIVFALCGLRAGELRALRWQDVDMDGRKLHVRVRADMWRELGEPKSEASERTIPIGAIVANALRAWRAECPASDLDLVFPSEMGGILAGSKLPQYHLWPPQMVAGLTVPATYKDGRPKLDPYGRQAMAPKYPGSHALRHFYASWLINRKEEGGMGLPPLMVKERMGHSDIRITMNTYSHLFPGDDGKEQDEAEQALLAVATSGDMRPKNSMKSA